MDQEEARTMPPSSRPARTSRGEIWYCLYDSGILGLLDPELAKPNSMSPGAGRIKGMEVDEHAMSGSEISLNHALDKLDPKTGKWNASRPDKFAGSTERLSTAREIVGSRIRLAIRARRRAAS